MGVLWHSLGLAGHLTLDEVIRQRLGDGFAPDATLIIERVNLHVQEVVDGRVTVVGLAIPEIPGTRR